MRSNANQTNYFQRLPPRIGQLITRTRTQNTSRARFVRIGWAMILSILYRRITAVQAGKIRAQAGIRVDVCRVRRNCLQAVLVGND